MPEASEGAPNSNIPKPFSTLVPEQKARAILAVAKEPVSKELLYDFAGIKVDELQEPEKESLEKLFTDPLIQKRDKEKFGVQQFWIEDEQKEEY